MIPTIGPRGDSFPNPEWTRCLHEKTTCCSLFGEGDDSGWPHPAPNCAREVGPNGKNARISKVLSVIPTIGPRGDSFPNSELTRCLHEKTICYCLFGEGGDSGWSHPAPKCAPEVCPNRRNASIS